ncbi:hypothetical protein HKCCE2091_11485 [Rhodobacterales bacterium HKCCE2091]|nr:hypothetical protein [Rhodobacterales bacterium HKCCE2091]
MIFAPARDIDDWADPGGDNGGAPGGFPYRGDIWGTGEDDVFDHETHDEGETYYTFAGDDWVFGGTADDRMFMGLGDDTAYGGDGDDMLNGQGGDDDLYGGDGDDELHDGTGEDQLFGGAGDDFLYMEDDDQADRILYFEGDGHDVIHGFERQVDYVEIPFIDWSFADVEAHLVYSDDGTQALLTINADDSILFTGLTGPLSAYDFVFS